MPIHQHPLLSQKQEDHILASLVAGKLLSEQDLQDLTQQAEREGRARFDIAVERTNLSQAQAGQLIAREHGWRYADLAKWKPTTSAHTAIPVSIAKAQSVILTELAEDSASVAIGDPRDMRVSHLLEKKLRRPLKVYFSAKEDIGRALRWYKTSIVGQVDELLARHKESLKTGKQDDSIPKLVTLILRHAITNGASDVHVEPQREEVTVRMRVDGLMQKELSLPVAVLELIILRLKVLARLATDEHTVPQDGKITIPDEEDPHRFTDARLSIVPTIIGEKAVLRLMTSLERGLNINRLGLSHTDLEMMKQQANRSWGMILVTGPTGSGKTTTLYSVLKQINDPTSNLMTIEDPVEYELPGLTQIQVNSEVGLTFATGLRTIVRQDPDIILVGEIRDEETADIAVNSAMTGHLVLSTLHTNDAATSFPRLLDMGVEPFLAASTVNVVIAQRLVRKICTHCIQSEEATLDELANRLPIRALELLGRQQKTLRMYRGAGCPLCKFSGYLGRVGIFEMLEVTPEIKKLIMDRSTADDISAMAKKQGMKSMFEDGVDKVIQGVTTVEEVYRVATST